MKVHFWQLTVIIMGWNNNIRCETSRDLQKRQFYLAVSSHGEQRARDLTCVSPFLKNLLIYLFSWSIVDLQRCVSFRCTAQWFSFIYIYVYIYILFQILFLYRLLQNIVYSFWCCTVGPCWLPILYIVLWIDICHLFFQIPHISHIKWYLSLSGLLHLGNL